MVRISLCSSMYCVPVLNTVYKHIYYSISSTVDEIMLSLASFVCVWAAIPHERGDATRFTCRGDSIPIMVICWTEWLIFIIEELREEEEKTWNCGSEGCRSTLLTQTHRNWNKIQWTPSCRYKNESVQLLFFLAFYYFHLNLNQQHGTQRLISFFFMSGFNSKCNRNWGFNRAYQMHGIWVFLLIPSIQNIIIIIFLLAFFYQWNASISK